MGILQKCYEPSQYDMLREIGLYTYFQRVDKSGGAVARIGGHEVIMCGSNNYLGLTHHGDVQAAAVDAIGRYGTGAAGSRFLNGMVLVDGVYSMDGDIADLVSVSEVCRRHDAALMVDDAHGLGVLAGGRGTCAHLGIQADLVTVTFSKALASLGGAVLGPKRVIDYIRHTSRAMIFTTGASPADAAAALAALRVIKAEPWRCDRVLKLSDHLRTELQAMGLTVVGSGTPILGVKITHPAADEVQLAIKTQEIHKQLISLGVYTNPVVPPAASCRLRLTLSAAHTDDHLGIVIAAFGKVADLIG